jgi:predicted nucleic acid-binding protein
LQIAIDTSVLVGLINTLDHRRPQALALHEALLASTHTLVYFDCVATETISTVIRRLYEKGRLTDIQKALEKFNMQVPANMLSWILPDVPVLYSDALDLIRISNGALNFNDALIALACRERGITAIASFDSDFDDVTWLERFASPEDLKPV